MEPAIHNVLMVHILIHRILEMYNIKMDRYKNKIQVKIGLNLKNFLLQCHK
jgi:hypothetical protein